MRSTRVHLWWIVPAVVLAACAGAGWWFLDSLSYGNASSLHRALMKGDYERTKRLIARGADVNARMKADLFPDTWGATPLHLAARRDCVEIVEELIRRGADKDAADELGFTPLHAALRNGADAAAQALLRAHAKVRTDTNVGRSGYALENCGQPFRTALAHATIATVRAMLDAGADPMNDVGENAMGFVDAPDILPKVRLLSEQGFAIEGASTTGRALHIATRNDDADAIKWLLDHGADIEARAGEYAFTPLLVAAYVGANDAVKILVERGANPKAGTDYFGSPVYAAAFAGKRETVRLLLSMDLGIDIQAGRASDNATPLHFAFWHNDAEMVDLLVKAGALPSARTTDGRLPTEYRKK